MNRLILIIIVIFFYSCSQDSGITEDTSNTKLDTSKIVISLTEDTPDTSYFDLVTVSNDGLINWSLKTTDSINDFIIQEFRWNKWLDIGAVSNRGLQNYSFKADTACGLYGIRVQSAGPEKLHSKLVLVPSLVKKEISSICRLKSNSVSLTGKTKFEIYNEEGDKLLEGCSDFINYDTLDLSRGIYYLNYANVTESFVVK
jgi:hypothetical protein